MGEQEEGRGRAWSTAGTELALRGKAGLDVGEVEGVGGAGREGDEGTRGGWEEDGGRHTSRFSLFSGFAFSVEVPFFLC